MLIYAAHMRLHMLPDAAYFAAIVAAFVTPTLAAAAADAAVRAIHILLLLPRAITC